MTTTDIRKGDLIKATSKYDPEVTATTRVLTRILPGHEALYSARLDTYLNFEDYDFEVLERPIDEELLTKAGKVYSEAMGYHKDYDGELFCSGIKAVIEFVRDYDAKKADA